MLRSVAEMYFQMARPDDGAETCMFTNSPTSTSSSIGIPSLRTWCSPLVSRPWLQVRSVVGEILADLAVDGETAMTSPFPAEPLRRVK